eukprot:jgi/Bigna1/66686/fgenesh1_pg.2_\
MKVPIGMMKADAYNSFGDQNERGSVLYRRKSAMLHQSQHADGKDEDHIKFPSLYPNSKAAVVELSPTEKKIDKSTSIKHRLGVLIATAISGNDILSSLLFVTALTAVEAGIYAPIAQILVVFTLWLYKGVYQEVLSALPMNGGGFLTSIFFGYGTAMLGVSGFESSSQFIEEQVLRRYLRVQRNLGGVLPSRISTGRPRCKAVHGVAVDLLRRPEFNGHIGVRDRGPYHLHCALSHPRVMFLAIAIFPLPDIARVHKSVLLSSMGRQVAGEWLHHLVAIDAFLVLAGAVLTAFVGVTGLVRRLALERCMPQWLLAANTCRQTNHNIILGFLVICVSMFLILDAKVEALSEMYSVCFLALLFLFACGHMVDGNSRKFPGGWGVCRHHREESRGGARIRDVLLHHMHPRGRDVLPHEHPQAAPEIGEDHAVSCIQSLNTRIKSWIKNANTAPVVFFTKNGSIVAINKAVLYIRQNEDTQHIKIVHFAPQGMKAEQRACLQSDIEFLDRLYPK